MHLLEQARKKTLINVKRRDSVQSTPIGATWLSHVSRQPSCGLHPLD